VFHFTAKFILTHVNYIQCMPRIQVKYSATNQHSADRSLAAGRMDTVTEDGWSSDQWLQRPEVRRNPRDDLPLKILMVGCCLLKDFAALLSRHTLSSIS